MGAGVWILSIIIAIIFIVSIGAFLWFMMKDKKIKCTHDEFCSDGVCIPYGKCTKSSECIGDEICSNGKCVQCVTSKDCSNFPGSPVCYNNKCVGCVKSTTCPTGVCDTSINKCVQCMNDSDCKTGKCLRGSSPELNKCVQCINNTQCPTNTSCINNSCRPNKTSLRIPNQPSVKWSPLKSLKTPISDPFGPYSKYRHSW